MNGTLLNQRYRLEQELGRGGMGAVYRAYDVLLERPVAVKVLSTTGIGTEGRARLLHEARAAAKLNHPNIINVYDAGEAGNTTFIVMELLSGDSLAESRPANLDELIKVVRQVCSALEHAHSHGIIHRDLKPENVILEPDGTVKLTDFGLARSLASRITMENAVMGTAFYMAPEQALGQEIDGRTDLYALGAMLYELSAGRLPFSSDDLLGVISQHLYAPVVPPTTYNPDIPAALEELILRLLSKHREDRPASAAEVRQALDEMISSSAGVRAGNAAADISTPPLEIERLCLGRLVGRERELAEARAMWKKAVAGEAGVVFISGEPGVGKTPLVRETRALAEVSGGVALAADCYAEIYTPYAPFAQLVREALAPAPVGSNLPGRAAQINSIQLPDLVLAELVNLAPDLRSQYPDLPANPPLEPLAQQQRLLEALVAFCAALAEHFPLLLIIEDLHWADSASISLLRYLVRRARQTGLRLLLLLTYRDVELDEDHPLNPVLYDLESERLSTRIKLNRYNLEQTSELLTSMFQQELAPEFVQAIYKETEGNLFFIEELCKALIEEGKVWSEAGRWHRMMMDEIHLPQSVRMTIQARLGKLSPEAQDVLRLAAIMGREFNFQTLQKAGDFDEEILISAMEAAERAHIIEEVRGKCNESFAFSHALIPATLYEGISVLRRHRLHRRVASALESTCPEDTATLAYHYAKAGDFDRAKINYLCAADRAAAVFANQDAIHLYSEALALDMEDSERFEILCKRSSIFDLTAQRHLQFEDAQAMLELAETLNDDARRCDASLAVAVYYLAAELKKAREYIDKSIQLARALNDPMREGRALHSLGHLMRNTKDYAESRKAFELAAGRFRQANSLVGTAACMHALSLILGELGDKDASLKAAEEALALSHQAGDCRQEAISLRRIAIVFVNIEQFEKALPYAEKALELHRELGDRADECMALNVMGIILAGLGRQEESISYFNQSIEIAECIGGPENLFNPVVNMIELHFTRTGDLEAGLHFLQEKVQAARILHDEYLLAYLQFNEARTMRDIGLVEQATTLFNEILPSVGGILGSHAVRNSLSYLAQMKAEAGNFQQAYALIEQALSDVSEGTPVVELAELYNSQAYISWLEENEARRNEGLKAAQKAYELVKDINQLSTQAMALLLKALLTGPAEITPEEALACTVPARQLIEKHPWPPPKYLFMISLVYGLAKQPDEAEKYLCQAYERMMKVSSKFTNVSWRQAWLEEFFNQRIMAEFQALSKA